MLPDDPFDEGRDAARISASLGGELAEARRVDVEVLHVDRELVLADRRRVGEHGGSRLPNGGRAEEPLGELRQPLLAILAKRHLGLRPAGLRRLSGRGL